MRHALLSSVIVSSVALLSAATVSAQEHDARVQEIFVPQITEFTQQHPGGVWSFDLSPDGKTLAVEFGTHVPDASRRYGRFGIWVALWSVAAERLIATQQLEDDLPIYKLGKYVEGLPYRFYQHKLRFSADGQMLLVLTGPRLVALSFPDLKPTWALEDPVDPDSKYAWMVFTDFSVSVQANRIAILREYVKGDPTQRQDSYGYEVRIASLKEGKPLGSWSQQEGHSESIGLSPDGSLLALALTFNEVQLTRDGFVPLRDNNVIVAKTESGELVRAFNTGVVAGDAQFLAGAKELLGRVRHRRRRHNNRVNLPRTTAPRASQHELGWKAPQRVSLFPVAGEVFLLTFPLYRTGLSLTGNWQNNGQMPRRAGYPSPAAIQGFNMPNHVVLAEAVKPGDKFQVAIFGINGPISVAPMNFVWFREAKIEFFR